MTAPGTLPLTTGIARQADYWATVWKRTWRGSVFSAFLSPLFNVIAIGVLLGGFVEADRDTLEGAHDYLSFFVPGLIAGHAMQTAVGETTYPVMGMIKWQRIYDSMLATPLQVHHLVGAHLAAVAVRLALVCGVFNLVVAPFGVFATWWGPIVAWVAQVLVGMAFAALVFGFSARLRSEEGFGVLFRLGVMPLFLLSGAFFPIANLGEIGAWIARLTPLWHGVNLSRMFALDHVTWWVAGVNVAVLVVLLVVGWFWSVSGLRRRLVW